MPSLSRRLLYTLKDALDAKGSPFFSRKSMSFSGDTMRNYGARLVTVNGRELICLYRINPVKHGLAVSTYFDPVTFTRVHLPH